MGDKRPPIRKGDRGEILPPESPSLPTSLHPRGYCPRCRQDSNFSVSTRVPITVRDYPTLLPLGDPQEVLDRVVVLYCLGCRQGTVVVEERWVNMRPAREREPVPDTPLDIEFWHGVHWRPLPSARVSDDVPPVIAAAFSEATTALHAGCPRAGAAMLRRAVEAITVDKGETTGKLYHRLKRLAEQHVLEPSLAEWASEVRELGNDAVHDMLAPVAIEDAWQLHAFMQQLLHYLYVLPAELARRRAAAQPAPGST